MADKKKDYDRPLPLPIKEAAAPISAPPPIFLNISKAAEFDTDAKQVAQARCTKCETLLAPGFWLKGQCRACYVGDAG